METDEKLHQANRAAHEVARTALLCVESRGEEHVEAWRKLGAAADKYKQAIIAIIEEIVDTSPPTERDLEVAQRMIDEYEESVSDAGANEMANYLKLAEVARRLGISERTARRYVRAGELPSIFVGNSYRVRDEDLERYLEAAR